MAFADRLTEARTEAGLSKSMLAKEAGISAQTIYDWESGRGTPTQASSVEKVRRIAARLGVTETWLTSGCGEKSAAKRAEKVAEMAAEKQAKEVYVVRGKDKRMYEDIDLCIKHLRSLDVSETEKRAIFVTLAEIRTDLEERVVFGVKKEVVG